MKKPDLAPPPRPVPFGLKCRVMLGGLQQVGWWLLGTMGVLALWLGVMQADLTSWWHFGGENDRAPGKVTEVSKTGASIGGSKGRSGTPIYRHRYVWKDASGIERAGVSYDTGTTVAPDDEVTIEFPKGQPDISRIEGMRRNVFGPALAFIGLLVLVPLLFIAIGLPRGLRAARLLQDGQIARGKLVGKEPTNVRINNQLVWAYRFSFKADDGNTYEAIAKTHEPAAITDEESEAILYDSLDPKNNYVYDDLPGSPRVSESGELSSVAAWPVLLGPAVTFLAHGFAAWLKFGS